MWWDERHARTSNRRHEHRLVAARGRRRASHSMEAVLSEAVALLDEAGEPALTFRALAARLGGGVASIYWYVVEQGRAARPREPTTCSPTCSARHERSRQRRPDRGPARRSPSTLFDAIVDRPWLGAYFMRDTGVQPNALRLYERLGQQVLRLDLTPRQSFHAVSAVAGLRRRHGRRHGPGAARRRCSTARLSRDEHIAGRRPVAGPRPRDFPFVHHIVDEFAGHDDSDQFRAGLDLLLAGLRLQADR